MAVQLEEKLDQEVRNLLRYVERLRQEVASTIRKETEDKSSFETMSDQLDAIIQSTADASATILECSEGVAEVAGNLRENLDREENQAMCDQIMDYSMKAMEACGFQDLTGQRITRIVSSLRFVEERVQAMVELCGHEAIQEMSESMGSHVEPSEDVEMHGPQLAGDSISQDDIDKLFD